MDVCLCYLVLALRSSPRLLLDKICSFVLGNMVWAYYAAGRFCLRVYVFTYCMLCVAAISIVLQYYFIGSNNLGCNAVFEGAVVMIVYVLCMHLGVYTYIRRTKNNYSKRFVRLSRETANLWYYFETPPDEACSTLALSGDLLASQRKT